MALEIEREGSTAGRTRTGKVLAVCYSEELVNNVCKEVHEEGRITGLGIPGDHHYGETRMSFSQKKVVPNDRPITVCGMEAGRDATAKLGGNPIPVGGLGENVLTEGLGDLSELGPGDQLRFYSEGSDEPNVVLEVRKQNEPCSNLKIYHPQMVKELFGKRGVICSVLKEGTVRIGDGAESALK